MCILDLAWLAATRHAATRSDAWDDCTKIPSETQATWVLQSLWYHTRNELRCAGLHGWSLACFVLPRGTSAPSCPRPEVHWPSTSAAGHCARLTHLTMENTSTTKRDVADMVPMVEPYWGHSTRSWMAIALSTPAGRHGRPSVLRGQ